MKDSTRELIELFAWLNERLAARHGQAELGAARRDVARSTWREHNYALSPRESIRHREGVRHALKRLRDFYRRGSAEPRTP
jgi:hypothetical protein